MPFKVGKTSTPPIPAAEPGTQPAKTGETGSLEGRSVQTNAAVTERTTPDPRQLSGSTRQELGTARSVSEGFINQPSTTSHRPGAQQASRLTRFRKNISHAGNRVRGLFRREQGGAVNRTATPPPVAQNMTAGLADAARRGIDVTKDIMRENITGKEHSSDQVAQLLTGGDKGLRRATTALASLKQWLRPEQLPAETLTGTTAQWKEQTRMISGMAEQMEGARFSEEIPGRFLDYGTSGSANPYPEAVREHPQLDHDVRIWLSDGVDLLDRMLAAQERALQGEPPLTADEAASLQKSVDRFANAEIRTSQTQPHSFDPGSDSVVEGFTEETLGAVDRKKTT